MALKPRAMLVPEDAATLEPVLGNPSTSLHLLSNTTVRYVLPAIMVPAQFNYDSDAPATFCHQRTRTSVADYITSKPTKTAKAALRESPRPAK